MERTAFSILVYIVLLAAHTPGADYTITAAAEPAERDDAELTNVAFTDALHGWAVGDRGAIWCTADGGASWQRQPSGVACRLESISFSDRENGWIAGGIASPHGRLATGVLLRTHDGGQTWTRETKLLLPGLRRVKFVSSTHGWALGDAAAMFGGGLFRTENAGREWTPVAGGGMQTCLDGDFCGPSGGVVISAPSIGPQLSSLVGRVDRQSVVAAQLPPLGLRSLRAVRAWDPNRAIAVGDGGLVLVTRDGGTSWRAPTQDSDAKAPRGVNALPATIDLRAVAVQGEHCWVAGAPGSCVFHSADGGCTWDRFHTGSATPIHALTFVDSSRGWAVGALGNILATHDGGRTWRRQRGQAESAALLAISAEFGGLPLEILSRHAAGDGYVAAAYAVARRDLEGVPASSAAQHSRAQAAMLSLGVSSAERGWQFPLRQRGVQASPEQVAEDWRRVLGDRSLDQLEATLIRQIRMWRPEVLVLGDAHVSASDPAAVLVQRVAIAAATRAGDARVSPEDIDLLGLKPWTPKKVYSLMPPGHAGAVSINTSQLSPRLGQTLADLVWPARCLLHSPNDRPAPTLNLRLVSSTAGSAGAGDLFSGLTIAPGSPLRRHGAQERRGSLDTLRKTAQKRRNVQAIVAQAGRGAASSSSLLAQLDDLTQGLDDAAAGDLLFQLALQYQAAGRWDLAAQVQQLLIARHPEHALVPDAQHWLLQFWTSGELAWRFDRGAASRVTQATANAPATGETSGLSEFGRAALASAEQEAQAASATLLRSPVQNAAQLARQIERARPIQYAEPQISLLSAIAFRGIGQPAAADQLLESNRKNRPRDAWASQFWAESWLESRRGPSPKPLATIALGAERPRLDGALDDELWKEATRLTLASPARDDDAWPAVAMLAADREFFYVAVQCQKAPGLAYPGAGGPRSRDADLSGRDRVELLIDLDRDAQTYYRLAIDSRGYTLDECCRDATWNPTWYVAAKDYDDRWTAELAIPWEELAAAPPTARQPWAIGVQRTAPGAGFQSWTPDASTDVWGAGFGLLECR